MNKFIAICTLVALSAPAMGADDLKSDTDIPYQQGRGFLFAHDTLRLGGYTSFRYLNEAGDKPVLDFRDLSFIINWAISPDWRLFSEAEIGEVASIKSGKISTEYTEFDLERLYTEYSVNSETRFRFGKFLTPIGRWNPVYAAPLVWSVSRPWTSLSSFAAYTTGVAINGEVHSDSADYKYFIYVDDSKTLDPDRKDYSGEGGTGINPKNNFENGIGARFEASLLDDQLSLGMSLGDFKLSYLGDRKTYFGLDFLWRAGETELTGAGLYRHSRGNESDEWGAYLQAATPIAPNIYGYVRHERVKNALPATLADVSNIGINYSPIPSVALKLEYRYGHNHDAFAKNAWLASFDVLF